MDERERTYYVLFVERFDTNVLELQQYGIKLNGQLKENGYSVTGISIFTKFLTIVLREN